MDDALKPRFEQEVQSGTPPRGVLSFVKLFFGQAKKSLFHKVKIILKPNHRDEPPTPQPVPRFHALAKGG